MGLGSVSSWRWHRAPVKQSKAASLARKDSLQKKIEEYEVES